MQSKHGTIVVIGTGGTIAGTAQDRSDNVGYAAAQLGVQQLIATIPGLADVSIEAEQLAQVDSKDMGFALWRALAERVAQQLARPEVAGIVITHGTDTLEESAYFLQRVLAPVKPVVFTAAMRPATALLADGPQNLLDAITLARLPGARGVVAALAGQVHGAFDLRKAHTYRVDAFDSGDAGVLGQIEEGRLRQHRDWPRGEALGLAWLPADGAAWPRVELLTSHAGADGTVVRALVAMRVDGIVVAGSGNGSLHQDLESALLDAQAAGVAVLRASRCANGAVIDAPSAAGPGLPSAGALTPVQARIELMLRTMR